MSDHRVIGVDIGGSHVTAGVVDLASRNVIKGSVLREHVNSKDSAEEILKVWVQVISKLFTTHPQVKRKVGIAMPGPFNYEEGVCLIKGVDKFESLFGLNVKEILAKELGVEKNDITLMNDACCFLKGEVFGGAAVGCKHVVGVTLGTGLGSARFHDGEIYEGDLYHSPFKDATAEDYLSTRWFVRKHKEMTGNTITSVKELVKKIDGEPRVLSLFSVFGKNLGEVLAAYVQKHPCERVVIGGNIINAWEMFFEDTKRVMNDLGQTVPIKKAELGEEGALIGAASVFSL
jgi:glucokinase